MKCWCGVKNAHFDDISLDRSCGSDGVLYCYCGGDQCVCHNHGEVECFGCEDCEGADDESWEESDAS